MALFENFPYTNMHSLNLDWIVEEITKRTTDEDRQNELIQELTVRLQDVENWIRNYDPEFIEAVVETYLKEILATMIFVEISDSGYFVYHIPDGWNNIMFNTTGLDIELPIQPDFGHLVLSY